jgi:putative ABC transport system permease protein
VTGSLVPRGVRFAMRLLLRGERREYVLGDLEEELRALRDADAPARQLAVHAWREVWRTVVAPLERTDPPTDATHFASLSTNRSRSEDSMLGSLRFDLAHAARILRRAPLATGFSAAILALGLGGTAAVWSVLESMVLDPLRFEDSERLVGFWEEGSWSLREIDLAREQLRSLETLAAIDPYVEASLEENDGAVLLPAADVTCEYFAVLRVTAFHGSTPVASDCSPGAAPTVVLSYESWQRLFGGEREIVGRALRIGGRPATVIGVMPPRFADVSGRFDLWQAVVVDPASDAYRRNHTYSLLGRLAPGSDLHAAQLDAERLGRELGATFRYPPDFDKSKDPFAISLRAQVSRSIAPPLRALLIAAACMLVIACANVANLQLVHSLRRRDELVMRAALGADRGHLVRQLLAESALLVLVAAVGALLLACAGLAAVPWLLPPGTPRLEEVHLTTNAMLLLACLSLASTVALAFAPTLRTRHLAAAGRRQAQDRHEPRLRDAFVVAQTALAVVLLLGALAAARHFERLLEADSGFDPSDLTLVRLELPADSGEPARPALVARLEERLLALPGVASVGGVQRSPLVDGWVMPLLRDDWSSGAEVEPTAYWRAVTASYFETVDLAVMRGRAFEPGDDAAADPVAIVNEELARRFFEGQDPIGRRVRMPLHEHFSTIVGIVRDERLLGPARAAPAVLYQPFAQAPASRSFTFALEIERDGTAGTLAPEARRAVAEIDPRIAVAEIEPLADALVREVQPLRSLAALLSALALLGVVLGALGLFGVLSSNVLRRTREIGVRLALGADSRQVLRLVVSQSILLTAIGTALGLGLATLLLRTLDASLQGFRPGSVEASVAVLALLLASFAASIWPALRAVRIEPTTALRSD